MKKLSKKQRQRDILIGVRFRRRSRRSARRDSKPGYSPHWLTTKRWIDISIRSGLNAIVDSRCRVSIFLPEKMNFSTEYNDSILYISAIRKLAKTFQQPRSAYQLIKVNFDQLRSISSSAALVLTAELSRWDDAVRQRLRPTIDNWDPDVLARFDSLGFFELFQNYPRNQISETANIESNIRIVKYLKGKTGDSQKARELKAQITEIVGEKINKWALLRSCE